jgi:hypothetical protein
VLGGGVADVGERPRARDDCQHGDGQPASDREQAPARAHRPSARPGTDDVAGGAGLGDRVQLAAGGRRTGRARPRPLSVHGDQHELPDEAECTQASRPATRNPVSSKCSATAPASAPRTASSADAAAAAICLVMEARAPGDGAQPNRSAIAWQARSRDRKLLSSRASVTSVFLQALPGAGIIPAADEVILRTIVIQFDGRVVEVFGNSAEAMRGHAALMREPKIGKPDYRGRSEIHVHGCRFGVDADELAELLPLLDKITAAARAAQCERRPR